MNWSFILSALLLLNLASYAPAHADKVHSHCKKTKTLKVYEIRQKDIPLVIEKSGVYVFKENISYRGSNNAITIAADNVKLNLQNFSLRLKNPAATGILISGVSEVTIESDAIVNTSSASQMGYGILVVGANKVFLNNLFTVNHMDGVLIESSSDVSILGSQFLNPLNAGVHVSQSTNVQIDGCNFSGSANNGLLFDGANQDCTVKNSEFPDAEFSNLLVQQMNGMTVENCSFTNVGGDLTKANLVQFGDVFTPAQIVNDLIFKNCTIVNLPSSGGNTNPEGLGLYNVDGVLVDSCVINIDNTGQPQEIDLSAIHIGNGSGVQTGSNVTIRNTICQGPSTDGFYPDVGSTNVLIDNCLAANALKDGIFLAGTSASCVKNCTVVNNGTNGIFLGEVSFNNCITNNVVIQNGFNIITPITDHSIPPTGTGIGIAVDSYDNLIQFNQVFENAVENIEDLNTHNHILDNTTF